MVKRGPVGLREDNYRLVLGLERGLLCLSEVPRGMCLGMKREAGQVCSALGLGKGFLL